MKYEYKFEKVELKGGILFSYKPMQEYHEIINQNAQNGWRLIQIFAPAIAGYGSSCFYEMIFERPAE